MKESDALSIMAEARAVLMNSHFVFTSGRHGREYVNKDDLYTDSQATYKLCCGLAEPCVSDQIDVVVAPAVGGVILSQWVSFRLRQLSQRPVLSTYAERDEASVGKAETHNVSISVWGKSYRIEQGDELIIRKPGFVLKRGYANHVKGKRVLVVEDILTTGGSVKKVVEATRIVGGTVVAVAALVNRGAITAADIGNVPRLESLANITLESWLAEECPLCRADVPINTDVGKGRDFLARKAGRS